MARVGILGGSFNPVHTGHLRMAIEAREQLGLDRVELMPAGVPPHKTAEGMLPFAERLRLVELAVADIPGLAANAMEGARPGPSFTCDTVQCYRTERPADEPYLILGAGTFLELDHWRNGMDLPRHVHLVVANRWDLRLEEVAEYVETHWPDAERETDSYWKLPFGKDLHCIEIPRLDIKASLLRARWRRRRSLACLAPPSVVDALEVGGPAYDDAWGGRE